MGISPQNLRISIYFSYIANPFAIAENVFGIENGDNLTPPTATLYVPKDTKTKYDSTTGWKKFPSIVEMDIVIPTVDVETIVNCIMSGEYQESADLNNDSKVVGSFFVFGCAMQHAGS